MRAADGPGGPQEDPYWPTGGAASFRSCEPDCMAVVWKDICKLKSLDSQLGTGLGFGPPTHLYAFWEGFNPNTKKYIAQLVNASTSVQVRSVHGVGRHERRVQGDDWMRCSLRCRA